MGRWHEILPETPQATLRTGVVAVVLNGRPIGGARWESGHLSGGCELLSWPTARTFGFGPVPFGEVKGCGQPCSKFVHFTESIPTAKTPAGS